MKLARELERRLERLVDGISAAVFRGKMHPVDLANRLLRAVDLAVVDGLTGPEIGSHLTVGVQPSELEPGLDVGSLEHELAAAVDAFAARQGIRTGGKVVVAIELDATVPAGSVRVQATPGDLPSRPWAQLISLTGQHVLEVAENRSVVGRGDDADVVISHAEVSRRHAMLWRAEGRSFVLDLNSVNGTLVNAVPVGPRGVAISPGDRLTFGPATFTFRTL